MDKIRVDIDSDHFFSVDMINPPQIEKVGGHLIVTWGAVVGSRVELHLSPETQSKIDETFAEFADPGLDEQVETLQAQLDLAEATSKRLQEKLAKICFCRLVV